MMGFDLLCSKIPPDFLIHFYLVSKCIQLEEFLVHYLFVFIVATSCRFARHCDLLAAITGPWSEKLQISWTEWDGNDLSTSLR